jgi:predicted transcriptional regulator
MITSLPMRAARALLGIDQKTLAQLAGVSLPTIQRMEASIGNVRGLLNRCQGSRGVWPGGRGIDW